MILCNGKIAVLVTCVKAWIIFIWIFNHHRVLLKKTRWYIKLTQQTFHVFFFLILFYYYHFNFKRIRKSITLDLIDVLIKRKLNINWLIPISVHMTKKTTIKYSTSNYQKLFSWAFFITQLHWSLSLFQVRTNLECQRHMSWDFFWWVFNGVRWGVVIHCEIVEYHF